MWLFAKLAFRNLGRNRRRTAITVAAVAFGLALIQFAIALATGSYADMIHSGISSLAGHVVVQADGYEKKMDSDIVVERASEVSARIAARWPDAVIAPRLSLGGLLVSPTSSVGIGLLGVDGAAEAQIQTLDDKLVDGKWIDGDGKGIVIGKKLAERLGVGIGDKVVYMGQHGGATEVQSQLFRVRGVYRTGAAELDGFLALCDLPAAQQAFGRPDVVNRVTVHLPDPDDSDRVQADVETLVADRPELRTLNWREALPEIYGLIQIDKSSNDFIMSVIGLIVAMGVLNTVLMSVLERTREFGVMLSLGLPPRGLSALILLEGAFIGLLGSALGVAVGLLACWPLVVHGIDYSEMVGGEMMESGGVVVSALIKGQLDPPRMAKYAVLAVLTTMGAAAYPAWFVARLRPVEAMHHT